MIPRPLHSPLAMGTTVVGYERTPKAKKAYTQGVRIASV